MSRKKFKVGELYWIKFYDHSIGFEEEATCEIVGWIIEDTQRSVLVTWWKCNVEDEETARHNIEPCRIHKGIMIKSKKL